MNLIEIIHYNLFGYLKLVMDRLITLSLFLLRTTKKWYLSVFILIIKGGGLYGLPKELHNYLYH